MQDLRLTGQFAFGWPDGFFRNDRPSVNSAFPLQEVAIAWLAGRCIAAGAGILIPLTNDDFFPADGAARFCFRFERFPNRSEEHTSELQSLLRTSYAAFCLT